jgi:hypothetical protein
VANRVGFGGHVMNIKKIVQLVLVRTSKSRVERQFFRGAS